jgi:hypothetical protein
MTRTRVQRLLCSMAVAAALAAPLRAEIIDRVLAIVGGQLITLSDVHAALAVKLVEPPVAADPIGAALQVLIERRLIAAEVDRYAPPEPGEAALAERTAALMDALPADPGQRARLGVEPQRVRAFARDELRAAAYLAQRFGAVVPTDDDVARYYREHERDFTRDGVRLPLADVQEEVRRQLASERRAALIAGWVADLRRRTDVSVLYLPRRPGRP